MITPKIFYGIQCDRCGKQYSNGEFSFWRDEIDARDYATFDDDWHENQNEHYCPNCYKTDENNEIIIFPPYPEYLNKLKKFVESLGPGAFDLKEFPDYFLVKFHVYHKQTEKDFSILKDSTTKLEPYQEDYIKNLIGNNLIQFDTKETKYTVLRYIIKLKK